jgi:hypothetical protein
MCEVVGEDLLGQHGQPVRRIVVVAVVRGLVHERFAEHLVPSPVTIKRLDKPPHRRRLLLEHVSTDGGERVGHRPDGDTGHRGDVVAGATRVPVERAIDAVVDHGRGERHRAPRGVRRADDAVVADFLIDEVRHLGAKRRDHVVEPLELTRVARRRPEALGQVEVAARRHPVFAIAVARHTAVEAARARVPERLAAVDHAEHERVAVEHGRHAEAVPEDLTAAEQKARGRPGTDLGGEPWLRQARVLERGQTHERQLVGRVAAVGRQPADIEILKVGVRAASLGLA